MRVVNIGSGSKGNCTYIECGNHHILVDIGFSFKQTTKRLKEIGVDISFIDTILITHEHTDHIKGLHEALNHNINVYIEQNCARVLGITNRRNVFFINDEDFYIDDIQVQPFYLSHDAIACLGFRVKYKDAAVAFLTDTGVVPDGIITLLKDCKVVFIESNHEEELLMQTKYPYMIKKRIISDIGHLSNSQCGNAIVKLAFFGVKYFALCHLSENSNTKEIACNTVARIIENAGFVINEDVVLRLTRQEGKSNNFIIGE